MLTRMTDDDWAIVLDLFRACRSRRGAEGRDDRRFVEALHDFAVHDITWRALPAGFGNRNGVGKRFRRLSRAGVFGAFFEALAGMSRTAHLVPMFGRHRRARPRLGGGRQGGGRTVRRSAARAAAPRPRSISRSTSTACRSPSTRPRARRATAPGSRSCSTSGRRSRPAPRWATRATTPGATVPRRAGHPPGDPVQVDGQGPADLLPQDAVPGASPRRAAGRQAQALQAHRAPLRGDGRELRLLRRPRARAHPHQIRPHGLAPARTPRIPWNGRRQRGSQEGVRATTLPVVEG